MNALFFSLAACLLVAVVQAKLTAIDVATAFEKANTTKDNGVSAEELHAFLKSQGHTDISEKEAVRLVRAVDINNSKHLEKKEFDKLISFRNKFVELDNNGNCKLSAEEIKPFFSNLGFDAKDVAELIAEVDEDHDGIVDLDEFVFLAAIVEDFKTLDKNGNKIASEAELTEYLKSCGAQLDGNDVKRLIIAADDDNNGKIDVDEFAKIFLIYDAFSFFDKDKSGELCKEEVKNFLADVGTTIDEDDLNRLIKVVDEDKNGKVDLDEFAFIYVAQQAFKKHNKNTDNEIDQHELKAYFTDVKFKIPEADIPKAISALDQDKNGKLDFDEFTELVQAYKFFSALDTDKNGHISQAEAQECAKIIGKSGSPEEVVKNFLGADTTQDGKIDFPEFAAFYASYNSKK